MRLRVAFLGAVLVLSGCGGSAPAQSEPPSTQGESPSTEKEGSCTVTTRTGAWVFGLEAEPLDLIPQGIRFSALWNPTRPDWVVGGGGQYEIGWVSLEDLSCSWS